MTIRSKLAYGLFAIIVALLLPLLFALRSLERLHDSAVALKNGEFAASLLLGRMRTGIDDLRRAELNVLFLHTRESRATMDSTLESLRLMADSLGGFALTRESAQIESSLDSVKRLMPLEYAAATSGDTLAADSISTRHVAPAITRMDLVLAGAERALGMRTSEHVESAAVETEVARQAGMAALGMAFVLAVAISFMLWRAISKPVSDLEAGMAAVAGGNFSYPLAVSPNRRDEFGRLAASFRTMTDHLAELDKLKAEFISVASHELKTPINVVLGYLQLIEEGVYGTPTQRQQEILKTIDSQTRSLARLVHQLLDVSRFEAGGGKLDLRPTDFAAFLNDLETTFRVLALQRGVDFRVERVGILPEVVVWDPDRMNEVLGNLLSNSFKFTARGGTVELTVEGVGDDVHLVMRDTGVGIPGSQLPRIFEKFYQADNQKSAAHGGTGLGLAIAKQIVVAHKGTIAVESTVGVGTTITLWLPARAGGGGGDGASGTVTSRHMVAGTPA